MEKISGKSIRALTHPRPGHLWGGWGARGKNVPDDIPTYRMVAFLKKLDSMKGGENGSPPLATLTVLCVAGFDFSCHSPRTGT